MGSRDNAFLASLDLMFQPQRVLSTFWEMFSCVPTMSNSTLTTSSLVSPRSSRVSKLQRHKPLLWFKRHALLVSTIFRCWNFDLLVFGLAHPAILQYLFDLLCTVRKHRIAISCLWQFTGCKVARSVGRKK